MSYDPRPTLGFQAFRPARPQVRGADTRKPIAELDRVTIGREVEGDDGEVVPAGSTGTVVGIWAGGAAYEIEFATPVSALATVKADAISSRIAR